MATLAEQLYSQTHYAGIDGVQTVWNFSFSGGYILPAHVKAYYLDDMGARVEVTVTEDMLIGEFQLQVIPPVPASATRFVIYRSTPKDVPLVDFTDGALVGEANLDRIARQAVFVAAEVLDGASVSGVALDSVLQRLTALEALAPGDSGQLGFKALKRNAYTGSSTVLSVDNGKSHFKTDATSVTVPDSLPVEFLCTIANLNDSPMNVEFTGTAFARLQGSDDTSSLAFWEVSPWNTLTIWRAATNQWLISGKAAPN